MSTIPFIISWSTMKDNTIQLTFSKELDQTSVPAAADFVVMKNFITPIAVSQVTMTTSTITLTTAVPLNDIITLKYTPGTKPIRDKAGNNISKFSYLPVVSTSIADVLGPILFWCNVNKAAVQLVFQKPLDGASIPTATDFTITVNGKVTAGPRGIALVDNFVNITLATAVTVNDAVTITYKQGTVPIKDKAGNKSLAFRNVVAKNDTVADTTLPVFTKAEINQTALTITYSETLNAASVPAIGAFAVKVNGTAQSTPTKVAITGSIVTVTLAASVKFSDSVTVSYTPGSTPIRDVAGNNAVALVNQAVTNTTPELVITPVDTTVPTSIYTSTTFLYTGSNAVQTGMASGTIEAKRVAVIRGRVLDNAGKPLAGVTITLPGDAEFGSTKTRSDGYFDMAVNGGGLITVNYEKANYLPVHRQVNVPWQDFALMSDVVMLAYDANINKVDLSAGTMQTAQGSSITDTSGKRQARLFIPQGTTAQMLLADGKTTQALVNMDIRITEYTVGDNGPKAMPGELPGHIAYTYAVEYSVDQAVAAEAKKVTFNKPVIHYVENFLGFPTGEVVPVGYYDRDKTAWIPSDNGRVIKILGITNGLATLDIDGKGGIADANALASLGVTDDERKQLGSKYSVNQTLWRVPITHFTPWDCNWPYGPPEDAEAPNEQDPSENCTDKSCKGDGSIIEYQNQVLGEAYSIHGTSFNLHYSSRISQGYTAGSSVTIPLSGAIIPTSLKGILLEITVAGRKTTQEFPAQINQSYTFTWDGKDVYGQVHQGVQTAYIRIGYIYQAIYYQSSAAVAQSFGRFSGVPITAGGSTVVVNARQDMTIWQSKTALVEYKVAPNQKLGGWMLNEHHIYYPFAKTMYMGDGTRRSAQSVRNSIDTIAGNYYNGQQYSGDGGRAISSSLYYPTDIAVAPDGSLYIADQYNHRIRRIGTDGIITTVAGTGVMGYSGDGGQATSAQLKNPTSVHVRADGSLYIADTNNHRIRRVGSNGIITTVAGTGIAGYGGDEGLATMAKLNYPTGVTVSADGSIYIADMCNHRIRRVSSNGVITTVVGNNNYGYSGDGGPANVACLFDPCRVEMGIDGSLYITDGNNHCIRRVGSDGVITTIAGSGISGYSGDGDKAIKARLNYPRGITVATDGSLYIADTYNSVIRRVGSDGIITTIAGQGECISGGVVTRLIYPQGVATGRDGELYIADTSSNTLRKVSPSLPGVSLGEIVVPAEDGSELYIFDDQGRHLRTVNPLNKAIIYLFHYNTNGYLISVEDADNNITTIERDSNSMATAIVAPGGQRTALTMDANGYLKGIVCPLGKVVQLAYDSNGLMTSLIDHKGNVHSYIYDAKGLLIKDTNPAGGYTALSRIETTRGHAVTAKSALGRSSTYSIERLANGDEYRVNTNSAGGKILVTEDQYGNTTVTYPDGTVTTTQEGPDPRWGMLAPLTQYEEVTTPGGLERIIQKYGTATYNDANPTELETLSYVTTINQYEYDPYDTMQLSTTDQNVVKTYTNTYDATTNSITTVTPLGMKTVSMLDAKCRPVQNKVDSIDAVNYTYDTKGHVTSIAQGDQSVTYTYDSKNRVASAKDAAGNTEKYEYNDADKLTKTTAANNSIYLYDYDANGNCIQITMPNGTVHKMDYDVNDQGAGYTPPSNTAYTSAYDLDKNPLQTKLPGGRGISYSYDTAGRTSGISYDAANVAIAYSDATSRVASITRTPTDGTTANKMAFTYDGSLVTKMTTSGVANGQYSYHYDNEFALAGMQLDTGAETTFARDHDGRLIEYGPFTIERSGPAGAASKYSDGTMTMTLAYDSQGRLIDRLVTVKTVQEYRLQLSYNNIGKISQKKETIGTVLTTYDYTYDVVGQLTVVKKNGVVSETYIYDINGNRTSKKLGANVAEVATYDTQDRLTKLGSVSYIFNADGFLTQRGSDTFQYSATGELLKATLANGKVVTYAYDGTGRRIARTLSGATITYLYGNLANPYQITATKDTAGVLTTYYYNGSGLLFALERNGSRYYVSTDQVGSPKVVSDAVGVVVKKLEYDSFGNLASDSNTAFYLPIGFAGGIADADTGFIRFGFRDYDPVAGRWTAKDPIFFAGGQANLYSYCGSDPVNYMDFSGLHKGDKDYGFPDEFWSWYHKNIKGEGWPDAKQGEATEYYKQWIDEGKPEADNKGTCRRKGRGGPKLLRSLGYIPIIFDVYEADEIANETGRNYWEVLSEVMFGETTPMY